MIAATFRKLVHQIQATAVLCILVFAWTPLLSAQPTTHPGNVTIEGELVVDENTELEGELLIRDDTEIRGELLIDSSTTGTAITVLGSRPQIRFMDDDITTGFSKNDWTIRINDLFDNNPPSTNTSCFAIEDLGLDGISGPQVFRINAGAPASSLFVSEDGDVGMGTNVPIANLDIESGDGFTFFRLTGTGGGNINQSADFVFTGGPDDLGRFRINIVDGDGRELDLDSSGNLTVTGTVTTASQTLPDYVFEPDYELMSLSELAEFIKQEKHLPNVPSDADVKQAGSINMNQMQLALLEKVEELTLYTLEQQKSIEELQIRLKNLEDK